MANAVRLNSYQKVLAQQSSAPVAILYVATIQAITKDAEPFFNPVAANGSQESGREKHVTVEYAFRYKCPHETEQDRLNVVNAHVKHAVGYMYGQRKFKEGVDYKFTIEKRVLIEDEQTEVVTPPIEKPSRFSFFKRKEVK